MLHRMVICDLPYHGSFVICLLSEKDYFVKQLQLDEVIHKVILKFCHSLMESKVIINIHDIGNIVYIDEKWLTFILSQIVQNSIKYFDKQEKN